MSPVADRVQFRKVWGQFPTGVSLISFYEPDGKTIHGLTANSVCSVSLDPLLVLVCVDHKARSFPMLLKSPRFVMNILALGQSDVSTYFARGDTEGDPPFPFMKSTNGFPVVQGCVGYLDCKIMKHMKAGDHTIFLGQAEEIEIFGGKPLVFCQGKYTEVVPPKV